ncbi:hypothetical protein [Lapidilactobacillus wuchangensis]|uniref:hypothetical protein n=1 Tax=Lapidilactobacillus wuchangensis TaxID=2486001 RepID=UPI000F7A5E8F|nr:hypothetical protein [Lapidilactobacillus wuchangensis]
MSESISERRLKDQSGTPSANVSDVFKMLEKAQNVFLELTATDKKKYEELATQFLNDNRSLDIEGTEELLNQFNEINEHKVDYSVPLQDIRAVDFPRLGQNNKIEFKFDLLTDDHTETHATALTMYDARKQFLTKTFKANTYYEELFKRDEVEFALNNLRQLIEKYPDEKYRYRFVIDNKDDVEQYYLRAVVDVSRYKTYDNGMILFLALMGMEGYQNDTKNKFYVESAVLTDSKISLAFKSKKIVKLKKGVTVRIGVTVRNSEIADEAAEFRFMYWISYNGKTITLIDEPLFRVNHGYKVETNTQGLKQLGNISEREKQIFQAIDDARVYDPMKPGAMEKLFQSLINARQKLPENYRSKVEGLHGNTARNTYSLLELFDKFEGFATDLKNDEVLWDIRARLNNYILH